MQRRYNRIAKLYDLIESPMEFSRFKRWRQELLNGLDGLVLEAGVGTGKNLPYYPESVRLVAVDISPEMLKQAHARAHDVDFVLMDAEHMAFKDDSFDYVLASFLFCSVADPIAGLREVGRVVKPEGEIRLLEHQQTRNPLLAPVLNAINTVVNHVLGFNVNRPTTENVRSAGLEITSVDYLLGDVFRLIKARKGKD